VRVSLFPTCVVDAVAVEVGVSTVRVLRRAGHTVDVPAAATCCGQPAWNAGHIEPAAAVASTTLAALEAADADVVVVPAGSCATMIRTFWPELFALVGDHDGEVRARALGARVRELSELLAAEGAPAPVRAPAGGPTAYHRSCHMLRELRIVDQPTDLLAAAGCEVMPTGSGDLCCGFGGLFSVKLPELSVAMGDEILDAAIASGAAEVVGCDMSCLLHLQGRAERRGLPLTFRHLAEVLDESSAPPGPGSAVAGTP